MLAEKKNRQSGSWWWYPFLFVVLIAVVVGGGWGLWKFFGSKSDGSEISSEETSLPLSNLEIAKLTLDWIDSQVDEDGLWPMYCQCDDEDCSACTGQAYTMRVLPYIVWGKYQYYAKTGDEDVLASLNSELDQLHWIQYTFWNCKLLYDIGSDSDASDELKEKAKEACRQSNYEVYLDDSDYLESDALDSAIKEAIETTIDGSFSSTIDGDQKEELVSNFSRYAHYVSEIAIQELWQTGFNGVDDLSLEARQVFYLALQGYHLVEDQTAYHNLLLGIASLDLYQLTGKNEYLDLANFIYQNYGRLVVSDGSNLFDYYFFLRQLSLVVGRDYLSSVAFSEQVLFFTDQYFDYSGFSGYKLGAGAFITNDVLDITTNALMVGLLSNETN